MLSKRKLWILVTYFFSVAYLELNPSSSLGMQSDSPEIKAVSKVVEDTLQAWMAGRTASDLAAATDCLQKKIHSEFTDSTFLALYTERSQRSRDFQWRFFDNMCESGKPKLTRDECVKRSELRDAAPKHGPLVRDEFGLTVEDVSNGDSQAFKRFESKESKDKFLVKFKDWASSCALKGKT